MDLRSTSRRNEKMAHLTNKQVETLKEKLLESRAKIINSGILTQFEDVHIQPEDLADEADQATSVMNQQISFSMREREMKKLRKIDMALNKIDNNKYGFCEESGDPIEFNRLAKQPWAEYCLEVAEDKEREERHIYQRRA